MIKFLSLSSGSNGNCYYVESDGKALLIDVGIGNRTIKKRLAVNGFSLDNVMAVLVTHDHVDHIRSLGTFTEVQHKPVYATATIHNALRHHFCTAGLLKGSERILEENQCCDLGFVKVTPFTVPHDATQTVGYYLDFGDQSLTFITDIGDITDEAVHYASIADNVVIESNYDLDMLMNGNYPPQLKSRIITGCGHLSNEQNSSLLRRSFNPGWKNIFLCHLSANNNTPEVACTLAKETLRSLGSGASIYCLPRCCASDIFIF